MEEGGSNDGLPEALVVEAGRCGGRLRADAHLQRAAADLAAAAQHAHLK